MIFGFVASLAVLTGTELQLWTMSTPTGFAPSTAITTPAQFLDAYDALDIIGNGSFGIIRKVLRKEDGLVRSRAFSWNIKAKHGFLCRYTRVKS